MGLNSGTVNGSYERKGNSLILNGGIRPNAEIIKVAESNSGNSDSIYIEIKDFRNIPLPAAGVMIDSGLRGITDIEGRIVFKKISEFQKIMISYLGLNIPECKIRKINSNFFSIQIDVNINKPVYFDKVRVFHRGSKLIMKGNPLMNNRTLKLEKAK